MAECRGAATSNIIKAGIWGVSVFDCSHVGRAISSEEFHLRRSFFAAFRIRKL